MLQRLSDIYVYTVSSLWHCIFLAMYFNQLGISSKTGTYLQFSGTLVKVNKSKLTVNYTVSVPALAWTFFLFFVCLFNWNNGTFCCRIWFTHAKQQSCIILSLYRQPNYLPWHHTFLTCKPRGLKSLPMHCVLSKYFAGNFFLIPQPSCTGTRILKMSRGTKLCTHTCRSTSH